MLRNYLKIAGRTLRRNKTYAVINIVGLALGILCCVLLALFVRSEWTYDQFHEKADRIVRVNRVAPDPSGDRVTHSSSPAPLGPALAETFPEVEATVRVADGSVQISRGENQFEAEALYADSTFFEVFSFEMQRGNPRKALRSPSGIVLTETAARTYFGAEDPISESLTVQIGEESIQVEVTGVVEPPPTRSSLQFEVLLPFETKKYSYSGLIRKVVFQRWDIPVASTFALLQQADQRTAFESKLDAFAAEHFESTSPSQGSKEVEVYSEDTGTSGVRLALQPLTDVHLNPDISPTALTAPSDPVYSYLLAGAALLVLLIAGINFTTLALGRSAGRTREVGVRKVLGAQAGQVRRQFWGEALLTSGVALGLGIALAALFLPTFNQMADTELHFRLSPTVALGLLGLTGVVGLLAGSYPALVLSRFDPASILRGTEQIGGRSWLMRGLVVVQFALSVALVTGTLVMSEQLDFMRSNLGFQSEQVLRIGQMGTSTGAQLYEPFRREALRHTSVQQVGASMISFFGGGGLDAPIAGDTIQVTPGVLPVDSTFMETMGLEVIGGHSFTAPQSAGQEGVLVNEAFVRAMGWSNPVGKTIRFESSSMMERVIGSVTITGVVENFHTRSMRHRIRPLLLASNASFGSGVGSIYVRIGPERPGETLDALRETWTEVASGQPFQYSFLDEVVDEAYRTEQRMRALVQYAASFALLIACFGLFGLAALAVARRTREVGIRKALGASVVSIVGLFTKDVLRLVIVAFVLAVPLAYWGAQQWLQNFAYRIDLGPWLFLGAGGLVAGIAFLSVSVQAWRAARIDPATTLRDE